MRFLTLSLGLLAACAVLALPQNAEAIIDCRDMIGLCAEDEVCAWDRELKIHRCTKFDDEGTVTPDPSDKKPVPPATGTKKKVRKTSKSSKADGTNAFLLLLLFGFLLLRLGDGDSTDWEKYGVGPPGAE